MRWSCTSQSVHFTLYSATSGRELYVKKSRMPLCSPFSRLPHTRRTVMKRPFFTWLTAGVLSLSLTASAFAGSPRAGSRQSPLIATLEQRAQRLGQHAQTTTGGGRQEFDIERHQVQRLIERLKAGEAVDPREIDTLLGTGPQ